MCLCVCVCVCVMVCELATIARCAHIINSWFLQPGNFKNIGIDEPKCKNTGTSDKVEICWMGEGETNGDKQGLAGGRTEPQKDEL